MTMWDWDKADAAAVAICKLKPSEREEVITWFFRLLETMEGEEILRTAQDILVERLLTGSW